MASASKRKKKKGIIVLVVFLILIIGIIIFSILRPKTSEYSLSKASIGDVETYYTFSGSIESKNTQNVMASSVMQISEIKVSEGDIVEKDDILFKTSQGMEIKAQISGTVSDIYVEEDQQVIAGAPLLDIYDFDNLQVSVKVDEYDLSSISEGKEVSVNIGAIDLDITGTVSSISDTATNLQGVAYFSAVIDLPKDEKIKIGMTAEAKILNKQATGVITIPMSAIQFDEEEGTFVYIEDDNKKLVEQYIEIGINDGITVEVTNGLSEGQSVYYIKGTAQTSDMSGSGFRSDASEEEE